MRKALEAAYRVLADAGEPLHYREITKRAIDAGLLTTDGKTPEATVNAQLAVDVKKHGKRSRFKRLGRGVYALADTVTSQTGDTASPSKPSRSRGATPAGAMSFTDAAERILKQSDNRKPLAVKEITQRALKQKLIATQGRTPDATMSAAIYQEIQRRAKRGERQRFERLPKSRVGLTAWLPAGIARQIEQHNREIRKKLRQALHGLSAQEFEVLVGKLLTAIGFESVNVTKLHKDGGIDVRGELVISEAIRITMAVQAKKWKHQNNVRAPQVQQVRGSLGVHEQGLIITTSDFAKGAYEEARRSDAPPIGLMNGEQLVSQLIEQGIGVEPSSYELLELDLDRLRDGGKEGDR